MKTFQVSKKWLYAIVSLVLLGLPTGVIADENMPIVDNANDLCYETPQEQGLLCILGICLLHKQTVPIRNQGGGDLTEVQVISGKNNLLGLNLANFDCGVDDTSGFSHDCDYKDLLDPITNTLLLIDVDWLAALNLFNNVIFYNMPDYAMGDTHSIYNKSLLAVDLFGGGQNFYGTYIKNNIYHRGRIYECTGGGITSSADMVDTPIHSGNVADYNALPADVDGSLKFIRTMVAGTPSRDITGVHLDLEGEALPYTTGTDIPYSIIPFMSNDLCTGTLGNIIDPNTGEQLIIDIPSGQISATGSMIVPTAVSRVSRMQLIFVDPNSLSAEGVQCVASSSTTGNFARVAQCANSKIHYIDAFGQGTWDRCAADNGAPCLPSNGGYADPTDPSFDAATDSIYVNELGCFMCTFNIVPACTTDNFAIRPDRMEAGMTHVDEPNLLRAGEEYNVSLTARYPEDGIYVNGSAIPADAVVSDYTVNDHDYNSDLDSNTTHYFKDGSPDTEGLLAGTSEVNTSRTGYMVGGLSSEASSGPATPGVSDETVGVTYDDIGKIGLFIYDKEWAVVDNDDTPEDCESETHTWICAEKNVTFIPHHFEFYELNITNHGGPDNNFTYVANETAEMSAKVQTRIMAMNKNSNITRNFRVDSGIYKYYENNISVNLTVQVNNADDSTADYNNSYRYPLANESNISNALIGFGRPQDINGSGTHDIFWDEPTYPLHFNFPRDQTREENPFDVNGSYLSIRVTSMYEDPEDGDIAIIEGNRIGDRNTSAVCIEPFCIRSNAEGNATFMYGRTRASKFFYEDITGGSVKTPVAVYIYCNNTERSYQWCDDHQVDTVFGQTSIPHWWLSTGHIAQRDGNVTLTIGDLTEGEGDPKLKHDGAAEGETLLINAQQGVDGNISVIGYTSERPMTVEIDLLDPTIYPATIADTAPWLIYNRDNALNPPSPFYKVRFIDISGGWTGVGKTGNVLETNASGTKNKRLDW